MTGAEFTPLFRRLAVAFPALCVDAETFGVWFAALSDLDARDVAEGVSATIRTHDFAQVLVAHVRSRARNARADRFDRAPRLVLEPALPPAPTPAEDARVLSEMRAWLDEHGARGRL